MRVLITGGAGFIGSALANQLAANGHEVRVIDDLSSGERDNLDSSIHFTRGDVSNIPKLWSLLQGVDCVYHLAARVSVAESVLYPRDYNEVNVGGTVSLMEAIRDAGVKRVVLGSSGAVYGRQSEQPVPETAALTPDSPYAVSKLSAEQYLHTIGSLWGIETVALRIFNVYGPGQNLPVSHAPVVPRFLRQAVHGGSLVIFGEGSQSRDFVYLADVIDALIQAATAADINRQVINIGSGTGTTIRELVQTIEQVCGTSVSCLHNKEKGGGIQTLTADISKAARLLNYTPKISLTEGLKMTLKQDSRFQPKIARSAARPLNTSYQTL